MRDSGAYGETPPDGPAGPAHRVGRRGRREEMALMPHSEDPDESDAHTSPAGPVDGKGGARLRLVIGIVVGLALLGGGIGFLLMLVPAAPPRVQGADGTRMELETVPAEPTAGAAPLRAGHPA